MRQLLFLGPEPTARVIMGPARNGVRELWFKWREDWVRAEWCGQFPDGTPRPPWYDKLFMRLWVEEGPDAARDKAKYDLREQEALLA
jgi:hypothetical protein